MATRKAAISSAVGNATTAENIAIRLKNSGSTAEIRELAKAVQFAAYAVKEMGEAIKRDDEAKLL